MKLFIISVVSIFFFQIFISTLFADEKKCCCSTKEVDECLSKELKKADIKLNNIYKKLLSQQKENDQQSNKAAQGGAFANTANSEHALIEAQKAWIKYRDANCDFYYSVPYPGTGAGLEYGECMVRMTKERTKELERQIEK
jgi:uncharacterized protein YecT (DUF1311 family)